MDRVLAHVRQSTFLRHNAVFFAGSLGVAALNYLFYPVLGRLMKPAEFGEVQTLVTIFTQITIFLGILTYVTIRVTVDTDDIGERNEKIRALEYLALSGGLAISIICLLLTGFVRDFLQLSSGWPFVILVVSVMLTIPLLMRMAYLRGRKYFARAALTDGIGSATKLILSPILVVAGLKSVGALAGIAISQVVALVFGVVWAYRAGLKEFGFKRSHLSLSALKHELRYAFSVFSVSGSIITMVSLDILSIKHYFPPEQAGVYSGMSVVSMIIFFLTTPFTGVMLTLVSLKKSRRQNVLWLRGSLALVLLTAGAAVLFMAIWPDFVIRLLVSSKYLAYADLLPRMCAAMLLLGLANVLLMYHVALRRYAFGLFPVGALAFSIILIIVRHDTISQIVDSIVIGSALTVLASFMHTFLRKERQGVL